MTNQAALWAMTGDPASCCQLVVAQTHMFLAVQYMGSVGEGVHEQLARELDMYCSRLEGVPLAYRHTALLGEHARIVDIAPVLHINVQAEYAVFQPRVGSVLQATINKVNPDFVIGLVHEKFNVTLPRAGCSAELVKGQVVVFEVVKIYTNSGVLALRGRLRMDSFSLPSYCGLRRQAAAMATSLSVSADLHTSLTTSAGLSTSAGHATTADHATSAHHTDTTQADYGHERLGGALEPPASKKRKKKRLSGDSVNLKPTASIEPWPSTLPSPVLTHKDRGVEFAVVSRNVTSGFEGESLISRLGDDKIRVKSEFPDMQSVLVKKEKKKKRKREMMEGLVSVTGISQAHIPPSSVVTPFQHSQSNLDTNVSGIDRSKVCAIQSPAVQGLGDAETSQSNLNSSAGEPPKKKRRKKDKKDKVMVKSEFGDSGTLVSVIPMNSTPTYVCSPISVPEVQRSQSMVHSSVDPSSTKVDTSFSNLNSSATDEPRKKRRKKDKVIVKSEFDDSGAIETITPDNSIPNFTSTPISASQSRTDFSALKIKSEPLSPTDKKRKKAKRLDVPSPLTVGPVESLLTGVPADHSRLSNPTPSLSWNDSEDSGIGSASHVVGKLEFYEIGSEKANVVKKKKSKRSHDSHT